MDAVVDALRAQQAELAGYVAHLDDDGLRRPSPVVGSPGLGALAFGSTLSTDRRASRRRR